MELRQTLNVVFDLHTSGQGKRGALKSRRLLRCARPRRLIGRRKPVQMPTFTTCAAMLLKQNAWATSLVKGVILCCLSVTSHLENLRFPVLVTSQVGMPI